MLTSSSQFFYQTLSSRLPVDGRGSAWHTATSHSRRSTDSIPQQRGREISVPGHNVELVFGGAITYNYPDLVTWRPPRDVTCRGFFGQFLLQQSAYADLQNDECPAWHQSLQRLDRNATEGWAPMSGPSTVVLVPLNYRFTPTSAWLRRH